MSKKYILEIERANVMKLDFGTKKKVALEIRNKINEAGGEAQVILVSEPEVINNYK